jgi:LysR family transcriptional regulator, nod-box dependent transcriptional activator
VEFPVRFQRLDLNLLVALDALLTERSVSLAAERICLSQSATSSALGRLREYFGDELLVAKGRQMVLTSRAEQLVEPVRAVLQQIRSTIAIQPPFDPATSDRTLTVMASDYTTEVLLSVVLAEMTRLAPHMRFDITPMSESPIEALERSGVDLLVTVDYALSADHPQQLLFEEDHVAVAWIDNTQIHEGMTEELYFSLGHVTTRFGKTRIPAFEDWFHRKQGRTRHVEVVSPSFLAAAGLVIGTQRITTMHRRLAYRLAKYLPLRVYPLPFEMPVIRESAQWHLSNDNDPAIRWFVERLVLSASALADGRAADGPIDTKAQGTTKGSGHPTDPLQPRGRRTRG